MNSIMNILSYPLSVIFYLLFGLLLVVFDLIQRICYNLFGYKAHKVSVDVANGLVLVLLHVLFTSFSFNSKGKIPKGVPIIIVANHQSMWDISPLIWFLRRIHPKFISKKELGKGIPTISYNLTHGGSVLIDRKNSVQAKAEIEKIANYISTHNRSVVIFPEGTRSRDGIPKRFHRNGMRTLIKHAPDAWVLPISINNSWKLQRHGMFPIPLGSRLKMEVHQAIKASDFEQEALIDQIESTIKANLKQT